LPASADPQSDLAQARHELAISEQVLARMTERSEAARSDPVMGAEQRQSLEDYVARVRELVALNRERVRKLALTADSALPAPAAAAAGAGAGQPPQAATPAEEVAALEAKLGGSLSEFDQLLLEEARRARAPGGGGGSGSAGGSGGDAAGAGASKGGGTGTRSSKAPGVPDPGSAGEKTGRADPAPTGSTASAPPADVGDGADDDVVARQIRKAAESERDPQLREKLWDEYRKYKQGTKG
jgi:hypothetical protein